ncbi:elongation of very long chain fatty acids protein-like protein [Dinothrombium tinctorium]|uniref:Elongation of very long chain fatty acids protein n=1 Tax=Dinothrombium tinctorium TaxID=1965070 RepID=A0A443QEU8_9ACAR|nr:elongation of very long chain fatty acids protein-like protein [Dinothrombium tinctorium]
MINKVVAYFHRDLWTGVNPLVEKWPLLSGDPSSVLFLTTVYVYFAKVLGPHLMRNRKPYDLRMFMFAYDVFMVFINLYIFVKLCFYTTFGFDTWGCRPVGRYKSPDDPELVNLFSVAYIYFVSKFFDFCDTIFFVFRKKFAHISNLHLLHHSIMPIICWVGFKYIGNMSAAFVPCINSLVHIIMYTYYACASYGEQLSQYLWWKKYLTSLQIIQLILVVIHCTHFLLIPDCDSFPKAFIFLMIFLGFILIYLFLTFYNASYRKRRHSRKCQTN